MPHIITYLFVKQTDHNGQGIVDNDTPKHKVVKERPNEFQNYRTQWTYFLAYGMSKDNNYKWSNDDHQGVNNGFENDLLIKASVLKPGIDIKHFKHSNK